MYMMAPQQQVYMPAQQTAYMGGSQQMSTAYMGGSLAMPAPLAPYQVPVLAPETLDP